MRTNVIKRGLFISAAIAALLAIATPPAGAQQAATAAVAIDNDDIGGVVTGPNGPEAGVWVIAETTDRGFETTNVSHAGSGSVSRSGAARPAAAAVARTASSSSPSTG